MGRTGCILAICAKTIYEMEFRVILGESGEAMQKLGKIGSRTKTLKKCKEFEVPGKIFCIVRLQ